MKIENFVGALIAAVILFVTGFMALLQQDGVTSVADISPIAWYILAGGALLGFLKDAQALWTRRKIASITGADVNRISCRPWTAILALIIASTLFAGCGTQRPKIDSISDGIIVTAADIESIATEVKRLCGNTAPGGACAPGSSISTASKERLKVRLQTAQDALTTANRMLAAGDSAGAKDRLGQVELVLAILREELQRRSP